jgi:hypothetical protein
MATSLPAPDPFPGSASMPDTEPDASDYDVPRDSAVAASITPSRSGLRSSTYRVLPSPDAFPGGNQIPAGAPDTTGSSGQVPRTSRKAVGGGTLP